MDYNAAKNYFEALVKAMDTYVMNAGGGTTGRNKYESANQLADYGKEIWEYIAKSRECQQAVRQQTQMQQQSKLLR
jgi:hypothetical protein